MAQIISRSVVFATPWFEVVAKTVKGLPGVSADECYFAVKPEDYIAVLAVTREDEVVLVRQYRPVVEHYTLELPAGHVSVGESPEDAARRELLEETGYKADRVEFLGTLIPDTGRLENRQWCYLAKGAVRSEPIDRTEPGIELILCKWRDISDLILNGEFNHALHLAAVLLVLAKENDLFHLGHKRS